MGKDKKDSVLARVLSDLPFQGQRYAANDLVEFSIQDFERLNKQELVDHTKAAIDYCLNELNTKPIKHEPLITAGETQINEVAGA